MSWWDKCLFLLLVGQMSWWDKCHGGTNVLCYYSGKNVGVGQMSYVVIGGTNVGVGQMSGGTNVGRTNVGGTCVGRTKVAPPSISLFFHTSDYDLVHVKYICKI
jgi:hypothetical protein